MTKRLKIICILFGLSYIFIIGDTIYHSIVSSIDMMELTSKVSDEVDFYQKGYEMGKSMAEGDYLPMLKYMFASTGTLLVSVLSLLLIVYIPIQTYKVIRSVIRNNIFDPKNIKRIRLIGYAILLLFLFAITLYPLTGYMYSLLGAEFPAGSFGSLRDDYDLLLFGFLVLLFAELMKITQSYKEENDLMI